MISTKRLLRELKRNDFRVAIFGSARIKKSNPIYNQVYHLAEMVGERGMDIVTGGGPGLMEAANLGHKKGSKKIKSHSIGLGVKLPHEQKFNNAVQVQAEFRRFSKRLDNFMLLSNAIVIAPGGVGTLLEFFYTWQLMQVEQTCHIPVILMGSMYNDLIKWLKKGPLNKNYFKEEDLNTIFAVKNPEEAMKIIEASYKEFKKGNKNFCLNYKKYRIK